MGKFNRKKLITLLLLFELFLSMLFFSIHAISYQKSSKVAMVPNATSRNGGSLYTGSSWPNGDNFTFTNVAVADIQNGDIANPLTAGGFDTVVMMVMNFDFGAAWTDWDFRSRITNFVSGGGKLIIYTSEMTTATAFSDFIYPFTVDTPGQTGARAGTLTNLVNDTLSSDNSTDEAYVNLNAIATQTDAVGDLTVMTSYDSHWFIDLFAVNVNGVGGPAHTYAFYGPGLIIFNGLDLDNAQTTPSNDNGGRAINMLWWRELCVQSLSFSSNVNGLTLDPAYAVNPVDTMHTVVASVRDVQTNTPIVGQLVIFEITDGPNKGLQGSSSTDENGETTFSWSSSVTGTDILCATTSGGNISGVPDIRSTAMKTWAIPGPLSATVTPSNWTMDLGQTKQFMATPNGGSLIYTGYQWYVNGSAQKNQDVSSFIFIPNATGCFLITATVTDSNNEVSPQSGNVTVIVNDYLNVTIAPEGPLTMNSGQKQIFTANVTGGSGEIHYQWKENTEKVGTDNLTYTFSAGFSSVNITCAATDNASSPNTVISNKVLININGTSPNQDTSSSSGDSSSTSSSSSTHDDDDDDDESDSSAAPETPTPTPPDQYPTPVFLFNLGWVEIAIITLMAIVLAAITIVTFKSFK